MSNNQNKSYVVLPGGKECRLVNPYTAIDLAWDNDTSDYYKKLHDDFEATNPTYAITEVIPEGETFDGEFNYYQIDNNFQERLTTKTNYDLLPKDLRCIKVKPLKDKEPVKQEYDVIMKTYAPVCPTCKNKHPQFCSDSFHINPANKPVVDVVENKETVGAILITADSKGYYNGLRVFNRYDELLTNWSGKAIKAKCMYDDNDGYQEWNVTNTPYRDAANGYKVRDCYLAIKNNAKPLPTPEVDELNLDERAQQLTDIKFPDAHNYLHSQPHWYKQGCIDALKSHLNHASFVALVEGRLAELKKDKDCIDDYYNAINELTDLLNKIK